MSAMATPSSPRREAGGLLETLGQLAVLPAIYVAAATALLAVLADATIAPAAIAYSALVAWPVYLLDRVKWHDAWLDPADTAAHPRRQALLAPRRVAIRAMSVAMLAAASLLAWRFAASARPGLSALAISMPILAAIGAWIYAGRPRRRLPRPKDVLPLKSPAVGVAIAAFAAVATLAFEARNAANTSMFEIFAPPTLVLAAAAIAVRVAGDAIWCDLDDAESDRAHRTASVPAVLGASAGWWLGCGLALTGSALALAARPDAVGVTAATAASIGTIALWLQRPRPVRDRAELRLPIEAAIVLVVQALIT